MNNTKKIIYIHIGTHKTATTYIQQLMCHNTELLQANGICYPLFENICLYDGVLKRPWFINGGVIAEKMYEKKLHNTIKKFRNSKYQKIVFSEEELYIYKPEGLLAFIDKYKAEFDIKVICYMREICAWLGSMWAYYITAKTWINASISEVMEEVALYNKDPQQYLNERNLKLAPMGNPFFYFFAYYHFLDLYILLEKELGKNNVIVRKFQKSSFENGKIEDDFFSIIGMGATLWDTTLVERNESPSINQCYVYISATKCIKEESIMYKLYDILIAEKDNKEKNLLTVEEIDLIKKNYSVYNQKVSKIIFEQPSNEELFDESFESHYLAAKTIPANRGLDEQALTELFSLIINSLLEIHRLEQARVLKDKYYIFGQLPTSKKPLAFIKLIFDVLRRK